MRVTVAYLFGLAVVALVLCPSAAPGQKGDGKTANPFEETWEVVKLQFKG